MINIQNKHQILQFTNKKNQKIEIYINVHDYNFRCCVYSRFFKTNLHKMCFQNFENVKLSTSITNVKIFNFSTKIEICQK